ncbi:MAG TPA: tyrosinase family protein, partial [Chitinophagaceae bacterium]
MEFKLPNRREFLKDTGITASFLLFLTLGGIESCARQTRSRPIRRRINPASPDSMAALDIYKDAVAQMRALPSSNPRSWSAQARIHGTISAGFNKCPHGTWFFLPWHRFYLSYFEEICQQLTGHNEFGLPYWNWSMDRSIPSPFWQSGSVLNYSPRTATASSTLPISATGHSRMETLLNETNFLIFGSGKPGGTPSGKGPFESGPHDHVHVFVGGTMNSPASPLDPLFWTHHCMIDYCWYDWNVNRGHNNTNDPAWGNQSWNNHFVDRNGNSVAVQVASSITLPLTAYQYEESQVGTSAVNQSLLVRNAQEIDLVKTRLQKGAEVRLVTKKQIPFSRGADLITDKSLSREINIAPAEFMKIINEQASEKIILNAGFARFPNDSNFYVRVFVNLPQANAQTSIEDIHYAGSFAFFGTNAQQDVDNMHHMHKPLYMIDLTTAVQKIKQAGMLDENKKLTVQF